MRDAGGQACLFSESSIVLVSTAAQPSPRRWLNLGLQVTAGGVVAPAMSAGCRSGWAVASGSPAHGVGNTLDSVRGNTNTTDGTILHSIDYLLFDVHLITST
jgi:hypothetical protein